MRRMILVAAAGLIAATSWVAGRSQVPANEVRGISGYVLSADGLPVSAGTVSMQRFGSTIEMAIDSGGRFHVPSVADGTYEVRVSARDLMSRRFKMAVPASGTIVLPPITLGPAAWVRVRFVSRDGQPVPWTRVARESFDVTGARVPMEPGDGTYAAPDAEGATKIGPLPRGMAVLVLDSPPLARTRVADVRVTGEPTVIDLGTVRVGPGAVLHADVVDEADVPVPGHDVVLEEAAPFSPVRISVTKTDSKGVAAFDRLASGTYRLRARSLHQCQGRWLGIAHGIVMPSAGVVRRRFVIGGVSVTIRVTVGGIPLSAARVTVTPEPPAPVTPSWLKRPDPIAALRNRGPEAFLESSCAGVTGSDGRATVARVPPGPARVAVRLANSSWVGSVSVPNVAGEVPLPIPAGIMSLRAVSGDTAAPVSGASVTWTSGGMRVEAITASTGDVLLEGVPDGAGTLAIRAAGYVPFERKRAAASDIHEEITLAREPDTTVRCRVVTERGDPVAAAVVELVPQDPLEESQVATTDAAGMVQFPGLSPGGVRLSARADGFALSATSVPVPPQSKTPATLTLRRGFRIVAAVDAGTGAGSETPPMAIRVTDFTGTDVHDLLDARSERIVAPGGRVSLGPLAPGTYVVELRGGREYATQPVRIDDRDVHLTFR